MIRRTERILLVVGLALLAIWGGMRFYGAVASREAIVRFRAAAAESPAANAATPVESTLPMLDPSSDSMVSFRLWSPKRIEAYRESLSEKTDAPLAILRISNISLEVPVFNGTDDLTLNRGVGRILGTAQVGQPGNLGIAGHRDGFFRSLRDIKQDDIVEFDRPGLTDRYVVNQIQIVSPEDTYVLDPTPMQTLTLVTCFPFQYVGSAPKRFIVTASIANSGQGDQRASAVSISTGKIITNNKEKKQ